MIIIKEDQRGLLFKDGNYQKLLKPGKYLISTLGSKKVIIMNVNLSFSVPEKNINLFLNDGDLLKELDIIDIKDNEIALHYEDDHFTTVLEPGKYAFWNVLKKNKFIIIDTNNPEAAKEIDVSIFNKLGLGKYAVKIDIANFEKGLLFYNGIFQKELNPGKYYYWIGPVEVTCQKVDMRQLQLDMSGQEIMTEDKVALRLNFVCHYKVIDPYRVSIEIKNYEEQLYIILQLILREYVGELKLDDLLKKKEEIGTYVLNALKKRQKEFGVEFIFAGLKDVILPGEIKDILNLVLIAQKKAQANIIKRREETASTRSILNTAKLMDDNPTLYKLKELEYLETFCEKIGSIQLTGSGNIIDQLKELIGKYKE